MFEAMPRYIDLLHGAAETIVGWRPHLLMVDGSQYTLGTVFFVGAFALILLGIFINPKPLLAFSPAKAQQKLDFIGSPPNGEMPAIYPAPLQSKAALKPFSIEQVQPANQAHPTPPAKGQKLSIDLDRLNAVSLQLAGAIVANENTDLRVLRDLSIACDGLAEAYLALGRHEDAMRVFEISLAIAQKIADRTTGDVECQRDLALSLDHMGDVLLKQRRFTNALERYSTSLMISTRLAVVDPSNAEKQRDLSISQENYGDALLALGRCRDAISAFSDARHIREALVRADPGNWRYQADLAICLYKLATAHEAPQENLTYSLEILARLASEGRLEPGEKGWIDIVGSALAECMQPPDHIEPERKQVADAILGGTTSVARGSNNNFLPTFAFPRPVGKPMFPASA